MYHSIAFILWLCSLSLSLSARIAFISGDDGPSQPHSYHAVHSTSKYPHSHYFENSTLSHSSPHTSQSTSVISRQHSRSSHTFNSSLLSPCTLTTLVTSIPPTSVTFVPSLLSSSSSSTSVTSTSSLSSTYSSLSSTASTSLTRYLVHLEKGLSDQQLDAVIEELSQIAEQGTVHAAEGLQYKSFWVASLTKEDADKIAENPIVLSVTEDDIIIPSGDLLLPVNGTNRAATDDARKDVTSGARKGDTQDTSEEDSSSNSPNAHNKRTFTGEQLTTDVEAFNNGFSWNVCLFSENIELGFSITETGSGPYTYEILMDCIDGNYDMNFIYGDGSQRTYSLNANAKQGEVTAINTDQSNTQLASYYISGTGIVPFCEKFRGILRITGICS